MTNDAADTMTDTPRPGTTHPHLARERALKVLFAADVRQVDPRVLLDEVATRPADLELLDELEPDQEQVADDEELQLELTRRQRLPLDDYTRTLVRGVAAHRPSIDELLEDVADRWSVERMPAVDRNLLRMAVYELAEQDTPHAVVIDEGVALAIAFAGEKARGFVNGVLETVRKRIVAGEVELELAPEPVDEPVEVAADGPAAAAGDETAAVEEELTTPAAALDEVDEAASAAYDLALDLLDAQGPLEEPEGEPSADEDLLEAAQTQLADDELEPEAEDAEPDTPSVDAGAVPEEEEVSSDDEADLSDLRDEDDALW